MAIHDVDTSSDNRTSPMPMLHDVVSVRKADGTQGVTQKVNGDTGPYVSTKDGRLVLNDGSNDRIIIGRQVDGTYSMKQSEAGVDVDDANFAQTTFDSSNATFQILEIITNTTTRVAGAGALSKSIISTVGGKAGAGPPSSLAYLSTYVFGAGGPSTTELVGIGSSWGGSASWSVRAPAIGEDYVTVNITYPANTSGSTIEWTFTIYLFTSILPFS